MRAVVQRVSSASVVSEGRMLGEIGHGLLVLVGIGKEDGPEQMRWMCDKISKLRIFYDETGKMNRSVVDVGGGILLVSQFTLYGDARKGTRPGFDAAAPPSLAEPLYDDMVRHLRATLAVPVETGRFGADMAVSLVNDGPVTLLLEK
ncbi:MAG TPA: D-aminoacyl-tRNA deacylase [Candidatus Deferrimicrobiaceae bacterium]